MVALRSSPTVNTNLNVEVQKVSPFHRSPHFALGKTEVRRGPPWVAARAIGSKGMSSSIFMDCPVIFCLINAIFSTVTITVIFGLIVGIVITVTLIIICIVLAIIACIANSTCKSSRSLTGRFTNGSIVPVIDGTLNRESTLFVNRPGP